MMKHILLLLFTAFFFSCEQNKTEENKSSAKDSSERPQTKTAPSDEYVITDSSFGKIKKGMTPEQLQNIFGKNTVTDTIDYGPEGDSFTITKIYPNTPKEIRVLWNVNAIHKKISSADCVQENSPYHTTDNFKIGTTLDKFLEANGKKISFYGTGWDYGGTISSYNNGKFQNSHLFFQLNSKPSTPVIGDREFNTDMKVVKDNLQKIFISKISLAFDSEK